MRTLIAFGNLERRFERMTRAVLAVIADMPGPVDIQAGANADAFAGLPAGCEAFGVCDFEKFDSLVKQADVVISHGGTGTIMAAIKAGRRPAVFVRLSALGEHIDDHQVDWCRSLFEMDLAQEVTGQEDLALYLRQGRFSQPVPEATLRRFAAAELKKRLHSYIRECLGNGVR